MYDSGATLVIAVFWLHTKEEANPDQMLALPHHELTETLVPHPNPDSAAELLAGPDQFAVPHQDLNDKLTQQQKLPAAAPVLDWEQNQALVLPFRRKSKTKTIGPDQAEGHQLFEILVPPLGSKSSKPTKFIDSAPNLKKDFIHHRQLAKIVVGSTGQLENETQGLEQQLQGDYVASGMDTIYPEESLPTDFLGNSEQPLEPPKEAEISASQQEAQLRHPETPEEVESFSPQAEVQDETAEPTEEVESPPLQQEPPSQPLELPQAFEPSLLHQEAPTQALGYPTEYVLESPVSDEAASLAGIQHHAHSNVPSVTLKPLDLELTITPEPTTEAEFPTAQQESLTSPPEHPEETESSATQQESPGQPLEPLAEAEPSPSEQGQPTQPSELSEEAEPFPTQHETPAQPAESVGEAETSPTQEEASAPFPAETEPFAMLQEQPAQPPEPSLSVSTGLPDVNYTPKKKQAEQNAITNINVCELCTCKDETLSCVGLSPKQKLHRVPEPQPNTYKSIFTTV
ncbi:leucine-rich repeat-containing protein 37B-like [Hippopotamus amphibius kiboko]|uniref:leucine-rich repeat-containing protein 37B-like n=1 Tax=Hippopotamus amphibius kiboko TaxID=575201 RepID=UPI002598B64C|nr:leucine-rich repeat-containing protein 37B-like [Hippopotamus amphibius kiboko]